MKTGGKTHHGHVLLLSHRGSRKEHERPSYVRYLWSLNWKLRGLKAGCRLLDKCKWDGEVSNPLLQMTMSRRKLRGLGQIGSSNTIPARWFKPTGLSHATLQVTESELEVRRAGWGGLLESVLCLFFFVWKGGFPKKGG